MGVCTNIFIKVEDLKKIVNDIDLFSRLLSLDGIRWYRLCEKLPDIESFMYNEYFSTKELREYLMKSNMKIRERVIWAEITEYDIIFAPDTIESKNFEEKGYIELGKLYYAFVELVERLIRNQKNPVEEIEKIADNT